MFTNHSYYLNDEYFVMTRILLSTIHQIDIPEFRETLVQFMEYVQKSRLMKEHCIKWSMTAGYHEKPIGTGITKAGFKQRSRMMRTLSPLYVEEPMAEDVVDQNADQCYDTRPLPAKLTDNTTTELSNQLLESENIYEKMGFAIAALKNELRKLTGNSVNTKFAKPSILGKPVLQPHRNQFVVRQPTAFKSERPKISKERFASQVGLCNDLSNTSSHYSLSALEKRILPLRAKPHYTRLQLAHLEVNSRAKVPSNKTTTQNKPVEQISVAKKPERQILKGHRFSIKKTTLVHEKTMTPRSCLRWKPTGRVFKNVVLRWVLTGKTFSSSTTKVDSEPPNGSNADITNQCESEQALDVSAGTLLSTGTSFSPIKEGLKVWLRKRQITQKIGLQGILI
ncbi:hypothetical protein Tco_0644869 [Tanacetum coccineum]